MASPFATAAPFATDGWTPAPPASQAARDYLRDLMLEKAVATGHNFEEAAINVDQWIYRHGSKAEVSANIDRLKAEGYTGRAKAAQPTAPAERPWGVGISAEVVPAGRYAIDTQVHAVNGTAFYKVDRPESGQWAGRVFVKQIIGGTEQRLSQKQGLGIIARIAEAGAKAASLRYGREIGECGRCGITLTNDESRAAGIGPECRKKLGW